ncbi:MAG: cysteine desulfurase [Dethiobacter sp.]|jgi:cysteine desulfurase|nr:cysteine desulfurase [Dethiobacter sp.]
MVKQEIYLDNSATTRVLPQVAAVMTTVLTGNFGNPSSLHSKGLAAERGLSEARRLLAAALSVKASEIYFTSGGTEANNLAVKGAARRRRRRGVHIVTTAIEHPSVLYAAGALEAEGFDITFLPVDARGMVDAAQVAAALRPDTILVSIMHVNNEVGSVQPVEEIGRLLKEKDRRIIFHVDAVQSFGKLPVAPARWQADLVSLSAHKIHGPKGAGALYCREGVALDFLLHGGGQEKGVRQGTENTAGIAGFAEAARLALKGREEHMKIMASLRCALLEGILDTIPGTSCNGPADAAPHILNLTVEGIKGEVLVHTLGEQGIYISTGSACHSHRPDPSHVLMGMGRTAASVESSLRFSFSPYNTMQEIDITLERLRQAVSDLRVLGRR